MIILNWNGWPATRQCLSGLVEHVDRDDVRVIVVDNNSRTDNFADFQSLFPTIEFIRLERNRGFSGGSNFGLQRANDLVNKYALLLNNDALVHRGFLEPLISALETDERRAAASAVILQDGNDALYGRTFSLGTGVITSGRLSDLENQPYVISDFVSGCAVLLRMSALKDVGFFDEQFFAYFEDVDLSLRLRKAGYLVGYATASRVDHEGSLSVAGADGTTSELKHYLMMRNSLLLVRKHGSIGEKLIFYCIATPVRLAYYTAGFVLRLRWKKLRSLYRGALDGYLGRGGRPPAELLGE